MAGQPAIGERLRALRRQQGLSQVQVAHPGLSDSYLSLLEAGKREPAPDVVDFLAEKLGCSPAYLLGGVTSEIVTELTATADYAQIALDNGDAEEARDRYCEVVTHPQIDGIPELGRRARWGYAQALEATGALDEAIPVLHDVAAETSPDSKPDHYAMVHIALSRVLRECGDLDASIRAGESGLEQLTGRGRLWRETTVMLGSTILAAYIVRDDLTYGLILAERLIQRAEEVGTHKAQMAAYWNAAWLVHERGDAARAVEYAVKAIAHLGEEDDPRNLGRLRMAYARFLLDAEPDQADKALELLAHAEVTLRESAASTIDMARCHMHQARCHLVLGDAGGAHELATRAITELGETRGPALAQTLTILGQACMLLGERDRAVDALTLAVPIVEGMEAKPAAQAWYDLADIFGKAGEHERELDALQHALRCVGL